MVTDSTLEAPGRPAIHGLVRRPCRRTSLLRPGRMLLPLILVVLAVGCGGEPTLKNPAVTGPHGLPAVPIPGGLGYAEARFEPPSEVTSGQKSVADRPAKRVTTGSKKETPARIAVYFLEPDGKTPLTPLPEKVQALLGMPGTLPNHYIQPYELTSEPRVNDPTATARFATTAFPLPQQRISGRVKAVVQGQEVSFPLVLSGMP